MPFDPNQIAGAIGGMNPHGGNAFMRGWQRAQQELQQRKQMELQSAQQQQHGAMQQEQLGFQRDANTRANQDQTMQQQAQQVQAVNSLRTLLGDESIDDPTVFDERMTFAQNLAPNMGVDPGFLQTLRPTPDTFAKRKLKKLLGDLDKKTVQERQSFEAGGKWRLSNGQEYTVAQAREALGVGGMNAAGEPFAFTAPEKVASANPATAGSFEEYVNLPKDQQELRLQQRKAFMQADDKQPQITVNAGGQGLPPATVRRVDAKTRAFESLPIVKRTQTMAEAASFAQSLDPNTKNPSDDQALIYAFAKAMDPDSVVREGEYATVQNYAQTWAQSFGFRAERIFSNVAFLTPEARANMKATIRSRYTAAKGQYENVRRSYADQINRITGMGDGADLLTDYGAAFPATEEDASNTGPARVQPAGARVTPPVATTVPGVNPFRR
jgi:hypothetical protein